MDKILQEIDDAFLPEMTQAQEDFARAEFALNDVRARKEEKIRAVQEYFLALDQKAIAEKVIERTPEEIKLIKK